MTVIKDLEKTSTISNNRVIYKGQKWYGWKLDGPCTVCVFMSALLSGWCIIRSRLNSTCKHFKRP